jgi:hypothetical protein
MHNGSTRCLLEFNHDGLFHQVHHLEQHFPDSLDGYLDIKLGEVSEIFILNHGKWQVLHDHEPDVAMHSQLSLIESVVGKVGQKGPSFLAGFFECLLIKLVDRFFGPKTDTKMVERIAIASVDLGWGLMMTNILGALEIHKLSWLSGITNSHILGVRL